MVDSRGTSRTSAEELRAALTRPRCVSLLIYDRDGVRVLPLSVERPLVVGRDDAADVVVRDASLSREHACFQLAPDGSVWLEDLDSTNGTTVNGERVDRVSVTSTDAIALGAVAVAVHQLDPEQVGRHGLAGHDGFCSRLEQEVARAQAFVRPLALLLLRRAHRGDSGETAAQRHIGHLGPALHGELRPFDEVALYSPEELEILLPEADAEQARAFIERAAAPLGEEETLRWGVAVYPEAAGSADALIAAARGALRGATRSVPLRIAQPCQVERPRAAASTRLPLRGGKATRAMFATVDRIADTTIPVLILGETGSGKELVARAIHEGGPRAQGPMICVNCGALPPQLIESTLFGHVAGSFTGAGADAAGVFEAANGGTVMLDEVGELPAPAQAALLRVLDNSRLQRVGSTEEISVDIRVIAATHRDLEAMCDAGDFRVDLFYRLNAISLVVPPLRERSDEIPTLATFFLQQACAENARDVESISLDAMQLLARYRWPGNVRELRNAIERAVVIADGAVIGVDDLPQRVRLLGDRGVGDDNGGGAEPTKGLKARLLEVEAQLLVEALRRARWNRAEAAQQLGLPLRTLAHKMKLHEIRRSSEYDRSGAD